MLFNYSLTIPRSPCYHKTEPCSCKAPFFSVFFPLSRLILRTEKGLSHSDVTPKS